MRGQRALCNEFYIFSDIDEEVDEDGFEIAITLPAASLRRFLKGSNG
jgi:hypothetical protein